MRQRQRVRVRPLYRRLGLLDLRTPRQKIVWHLAGTLFWTAWIIGAFQLLPAARAAVGEFAEVPLKSFLQAPTWDSDPQWQYAPP